MALIAAATSCQEAHDAQKPQPITPDIALTADEVAHGMLTPEVLWKFGRLDAPALSPDGRMVAFGVTRFSMEANRGATSLFVVPTSGGEPVELTGYEANHHSPQWAPDGQRLGFLSNRSGAQQLWEIRPDGAGLRQVTDVPEGIAAFWYDPTGAHLLFSKRVQVAKTLADRHPDMPLSQARIYDDLMFRRWDTWADGKYTHLFIAPLGAEPIASGTNIMEGEPFNAPLAPFFSHDQVSWSPCGQYVAYTSKKLTGKEYAVSTDSQIYLYSLAQGTTRSLTPENPGYDRYPVFSPNGKHLAWQSMATPGYESDKHRLMVMELSTGSTTYLTEGFDQNAYSIAWSPDGSSLLFISGIKATEQIYRIALSGGAPEQLTRGNHNYTWFAQANGMLVGSRMSMSMASELFAIDPGTGAETQLTHINRHIYQSIRMGEVREEWVETTDGKRMLVWIILPPHFDPSRRYPALLYCQGGPQSAVSQFWSYRWNFQLMAAQGYVVVAPNRRGLPSFGQEWNAQISGDYSGQNIQDLLSAIDHAKRQPWVDPSRVGAVGASYGGYSVFYLAGIHQGRFRAFIAHNGPFNLESMYGATEEIFFTNHDLGGPYWDKENPVAQRTYANSPHRLVGHWDTPMLIYVSEKDYRVPYTEGLQAFTAARLLGIPSRLVVFPDENHWVLKPQNAIVWHREFFGWLDRWLQ